MTTRALVLGGGGPVGIAWESGLAAGLAESGVRLAEADYIVGTSAGSVVGSQFALGRDPAALVAGQLTRAARSGPGDGTPLPVPDLSGLMRHMMKLYTSGTPSAEALIEVGRFALAAQTMSEESFIAGFGNTQDAWPVRRFACTAIDTATGAFQVWDNDSGVPLPRAVASSCAVPGIYPPITINGRQYMDGGMRSATNADLAAGYDRVLVVIVRTGGPTPPGAPANMAELARERLEAEFDVLRRAGGQVETVIPDDAAAAVMGINLMDANVRGDAAEGGLRQGRLEAARIRQFWD